MFICEAAKHLSIFQKASRRHSWRLQDASESMCEGERKANAPSCRPDVARHVRVLLKHPTQRSSLRSSYVQVGVFFERLERVDACGLSWQILCSGARNKPDVLEVK